MSAEPSADSSAKAFDGQPSDRSAGRQRHTAEGGLTTKPWWPNAKRAATIVFLSLVVWLLVDQARSVEWPTVWKALRDYRASTLLLAAALAASSYAVYCSYDLLGRYQTGHSLSTGQVVGVSFVSYAFNLNMGALVGGVGMRYKLYLRLGLDAAVITEVLGLSMLTNWLGYMLLAGAVFLIRPLELPADWVIGSTGLRWLGVLLLALVAAYIGLCFRSRRRKWSLRGHEITLPSGRVSLMQLAVSALNWLLISTIVYVLLQQKIEYTAVLSVMLIAAVAGVIAHVPAGLGVLEAVFVTLLAQSAPRSELLAALLAYRAVYYLAPLLLAVLHYFVIGRFGNKAGTDSD
jgi:uncharacterized membrane protein YbhN (UPF0104 family)